MEHTQKMVVVPQDLIENLRYNQRKKAGSEGKKVLDVDKEIKNVLTREDLSEDDKIRLYHQLIMKYRDVKEPEPVLEPTEVIKDEWLENIDKHFNLQNKVKARNVLEWLRTKGDIKWNDKGEVEGDPGSNILTLIDDITRSAPRHKDIEPIGMTNFASKLKASNIPQYLISQHYQKYFRKRPHRLESPIAKRVPTPKQADNFDTPPSSPSSQWINQS